MCPSRSSGLPSSLQPLFRPSASLSDKHRQIFQPASYERISLGLMGHISVGIYSLIHSVDDMPVAERLVRAQAKTQKRTSFTRSFGCGRNAMRSMLVWGRRIAMAALPGVGRVPVAHSGAGCNSCCDGPRDHLLRPLLDAKRRSDGSLQFADRPAQDRSQRGVDAPGATGTHRAAVESNF